MPSPTQGFLQRVPQIIGLGVSCESPGILAETDTQNCKFGKRRKLPWTQAQAVPHGPARGETRAPAQSLVLCSLPKPAMGIVPGGSVTGHGLERSHLEGR